VTILHSCDDLDGIRIRGGVENLLIDSSDFKEGAGALVIVGDASSRYAEVYCDIKDVLSNWSAVKELTLWLKALDSRYNFEIGVCAPERDNRWGLWTSNEALNVWEQKKIKFPSEFGVVGNPDIANVTTLILAFSNEGAQRTWKVDLIEALVSIIQHNLMFNSNPISVPIMFDGAPAGDTPITLQAAEGEHVIEVPPEVEV
jgi:hypothetical protein